MEKRARILMCSACAVVFTLAAETTRAQLVNGNFATGDFTGWTFYTTQDATQTTFGPDVGGSYDTGVVLFDTIGTGVPTNSAQFEVGIVSGPGPGPGTIAEGAGIKQSLALNTGQLNISLNIAVYSPGNNADAGSFVLLLNGNGVASQGFGSINPGQTLRSTLNFGEFVQAGTYQIAIEMRRGYGLNNGNTPYQYLANIVASGTAVPVPEPTAMLLTCVGLAALVFGPRRRRTHG